LHKRELANSICIAAPDRELPSMRCRRSGSAEPRGIPPVLWRGSDRAASQQIGKATGIGTFDYHPISKYGKSIEATGANTTTALVTMVNGFADEWSDAIERAKHGDYRGLRTDRRG
jgi:hypothetical protein